MDIVVIGGSRWSSEVNQPAQQAVGALAESGHRVFYLYREVQSSAVRNLIRPIDERGRGTAVREVLGKTRFRRAGPTLWVAPLRGLAAALPMSQPEPWRRWLAGWLQRWLGREERRLDMKSPVYWFYWWCFPELAENAPGATVYDVIDDHASYAANSGLSRANERIESLERRLLRTVDHAYAVSQALVERKREPGAGVVLLPNGINLRRAQEALSLGTPAEPPALRRPIIGYLGDLGSRLDWGLLGRLAAARPDWSFLLVGGAGPDLVAELDNLHSLPGCTYSDALRHMREFDVAILPLRSTKFTRAVSSLKLLDYLAAGRPVVASDLPFVHDVSDRWPALVSVATGEQAWIEAIESQLGSTEGPDMAAQRREVLQARSVEVRVARILHNLES